ncbi:histone chaperone ASF1A-like protein [Raphidocelis subcapitata]|uniref:Histone chaperone ASF1A-like protein n=1 Tax=Raphidocelis subcapitata TaxID=307507 RepID=A0A2V0NZG0_9CHLO|nr:histone chaperone ASF1A-like protein [Raphidocelis subcapitata]|eukprot:GBF90307.1 histone chaperone ASF1A-like protein [Raphidocelis subcapitata]
MAEVSIMSVDVKNNPAPFRDDIELEVQYECLTALKDDLEWKVIYVGSAEADNYDQTLDTAFVGPVQPGSYKFTMKAPAPDPSKIPQGDVVGVTALLLTCSYQDKEFVRVGYYVNNEYAEADMVENPPDKPAIDKLQRNIMSDHPRVTKFPHDFDNPPAAPPPPVEGAEAEGDEDDDIMAMEDDGQDDESEDEDDGEAGMDD